MINLLGKTLLVIYVAGSIMLMTFAGALYLNAVDYGWKQPRQVYIDSEARKPAENAAVPSRFDKREAAVRKVTRQKWESLLRLGQAQASYQEIEPFLADNRLKGDAELAKLENGPGEFVVKDIKFDDQGLLGLEPSPNNRALGFPALEVVVPGVSMSYSSYVAKLADVNSRIKTAQDRTDEVLKLEELLTNRMTGAIDKDGKQIRQNGAVVQPGWYYLLEAEATAQRRLKAEVEYLQPLWVKELVDAQLLVSRRDILQKRLEELRAQGYSVQYMSQSEFLKKLE